MPSVEKVRDVWQTVLCTLAVYSAGVFCLQLGQASQSQAASNDIVFVDVTRQHSGWLTNSYEFAEVLESVGVDTHSATPRIVSVYTSDSALSARRPTIGDYQSIIDEVLVANRGAPPIVVVSPWGKPEERRLRGSVFIDDLEAMQSTSYEYLYDNDQIELHWDAEGLIPQAIANRGVQFGMETISGVTVFACVQGGRVTGWAGSRAYRNPVEPTFASIGRFTEDCLLGRLTMPDDYRLPAETLLSLGLQDQWIALFLPDAYEGRVEPTLAMEVLMEVVDVASVVPKVFVTPIGTLSTDFTEYITQIDHALAIAEIGISVDWELTRALPKWIEDHATHNGSMVLLVDPEGIIVRRFVATYVANLVGRPTLQHALVELGLY